MPWLRSLALAGVLSCSGDPLAGQVGPPPSPPGTTEAAPRSFMRTCESSVHGDLGPRWRRGEVSAGPVVFVAANSYADDPPGRFGGSGARGTLHKVLIVVGGASPVDVSVPDGDAALAYDPAAWGERNVMPLRLGDPMVRFEPCGGQQRWTQFNGGFLVRGAGCVPVDVRVEGTAPSSTTLSFGAGDCS